jgi:hypothetical protein
MQQVEARYQQNEGIPSKVSSSNLADGAIIAQVQLVKNQVKR